MIKCNLSVCAAISRAASVKNSKEGTTFLTFNVKVPVEGRDGAKKELEMSVSLDGDKSVASVFTANRRVNITGILSIRKKGGKVYYNLRADSAELANSKSEDSIVGQMNFRGKISKKGVEAKIDKHGTSFKAFSAFSTDRDGDNVEFTWVRFLCFNLNDEDFLKANVYIEAKGDLQLGVYKDEISLDCLLREVSPWKIDK